MNGPSYIEQVETFFVGVVRRGLVLRQSDVDVAKDWEARGVPVDVVKKGVTVGIARFLEAAEAHEPVPATLKYYRTFVEKEVEAYRREVARGVVRGGPRDAAPSRDLRGEALERVRVMRAAARSAAEAAALDAAAARLEAAGPGGAVVAALDDLDDALARAAIESAPEPVRARMEARIRGVAEAAARQGIGSAAAADIARAETRAAATEVGFASIVDALL
jgi:hypothetical protein